MQVAASLLDEAARLTAHPDWSPWVCATHFELSPSVARNVSPTTLNKVRHAVRHRRPGSPSHILSDLRRSSESALTVFGPLYSLPRCDRRLMGYADVTSIYASPTGTPGVKDRIRAHLSRLELRAQHAVIVETSAMRARVEHVLAGHAPVMHVVPNAVNSRVLSAQRDESIALRIGKARQDHDLLLAYPTRDYPHKNLEFLPAVAGELARIGVKAGFIVTLRPEEWDRRTPAFRAVCVNLGEVTIDQVATVLKTSDGLFFPSLLEAYSASPVEAMALGVPVFASDRDFVRTVCGDAAAYFDPHDGERAATVVFNGHNRPGDLRTRVEAGMRRVGKAPTARDRAMALLSTLYGSLPVEGT
ncbi:glycosyltransferase [Nocardioides perillae]|uniref:Glycosyltransferase involved in cell wall biosynthesis n=1 Tax=Nocardioides perillae TaxID=1119534 RepID=A0A7Y9RU93_9ACTN|nr:glycosyltransferase involved in cell wall biosynthesis [Nocardioides perillae]